MKNIVLICLFVIFLTACGVEEKPKVEVPSHLEGYQAFNETGTQIGEYKLYTSGSKYEVVKDHSLVADGDLPKLSTCIEFETTEVQDRHKFSICESGTFHYAKMVK